MPVVCSLSFPFICYHLLSSIYYCTTEGLWYDKHVKINIRLIYLYLFSFVGLLTVVIGSVRLVDLGLKVFVFPNSDKFEYSAPIPVGEKAMVDEKLASDNATRDQKRNRQRELSNSIAMIVIGLPLYLYHWKTIQKENKN